MNWKNAFFLIYPFAILGMIRLVEILVPFYIEYKEFRKKE